MVHKMTIALAWSVHVFTALGALLGLWALIAVFQESMILAFWLLMAAIGVDAIDGTLARAWNTKKYASTVDGALLDNIIDFLTYTIIPAVMLLITGMLPAEPFGIVTVSALVLSSCYQFTNTDAKTKDHFFKGFPSYWNLVVMYMYLLSFSPTTNAWLIGAFSVLSFVPIKFIYPSRLDHLSPSKIVRHLFMGGTLVWGAATLGLLYSYPESPMILQMIVGGYILVYCIMSLRKTFQM